MDNIRTISEHIKSQFPSFYENDNIVAFLEAYYEYLENNSISHIKQISLYDDIDDTLEEFVQYFVNKYLDNFPYRAASDKRFLIKNIVDLYQSKGSEASIKLLMRILFGEDVSIYYPADDVFKPSDSKWLEPKYIELDHDHANYTGVGSELISSDGGKAVIDQIITKIVNGKMIDVVYLLDPPTDKFQKGATVHIDGLPSFFTKTILGSLIGVTIGSKNGALYNLGEELFVSVGDGTGAEGRVTKTKSVSDLANISLVDGGYGYTADSYSDVLISDKVIEVTNPNLIAEPLLRCAQTLTEYSLNNITAALTVGTTVKDAGSLNVGAVVAANSTHVTINPITSMFDNVSTLYRSSDAAETSPFAITFSQKKDVTGVIVGQTTTRIGIKWDTLPSTLYFDDAYVTTLDIFDRVAPYNYITHSEQFNNWTISNGSVQTNVAVYSPKVNNRYSQTVDRLVENNTASVHKIGFAKNVNGSTNFSVYAKSSNRSVILRAAGLTNAYAEFNLTTGSISSVGAGGSSNAQISNLGNGWYRCSVYLAGTGMTAFEIVLNNGTSHSTGLPSYTGDNTSYVDLFGAQLSNSYSVEPYQAVVNTTVNQTFFRNRINIDDQYFGSGANFEIDTVDLVETVNINSDKLSTYQNVSLASVNYGFQSYNTNIDTILADALNFTQMDIGQIASLKNRNPGSNYTSDLFVYVKNDYVANYRKRNVLITCANSLSFIEGELVSAAGGASGIVISITPTTILLKNTSFLHDFIIGETITGASSLNSSTVGSFQSTGDVMGLNAQITATVQRLPGAVEQIKIIDSGYGYTDGSVIHLKSVDNILEIEGIAIVRGVGQQKGFWVTTNSHISTDKKIHDNFYYQDYSFVIKSKNSFNTYADTIRNVIQTAGTKSFGQTEVISSVKTTATPSTIITP